MYAQFLSPAHSSSSSRGLFAMAQYTPDGDAYEKLENQTDGKLNSAAQPEPPRACGCQRWKCLTVSMVILMCLGGGTIGYLASKGAFEPVKHGLPSCTLNGTTTVGYCAEKNTGIKFPIYRHPLPYEASSTNPFPDGKGDTCVKGNVDYRCHTLTGLNLVTATMINRLMVVALYVDPYSAKAKLEKYKDLPSTSIFSNQLKADMLAGDIAMTVEWDFVLSNFSPVPTSIMDGHFTGNLKPYLEASGKLSEAEIKTLLDDYKKACFPVENININDKVRFTWNLPQKTASCQFKQMPYTSISGKGSDILAKAIFEFTLDYNKNAIVSLLPNLWTWDENRKHIF